MPLYMFFKMQGGRFGVGESCKQCFRKYIYASGVAKRIVQRERKRILVKHEKLLTEFANEYNSAIPDDEDARIKVYTARLIKAFNYAKKR